MKTAPFLISNTARHTKGWVGVGGGRGWGWEGVGGGGGGRGWEGGGRGWGRGEGGGRGLLKRKLIEQHGSSSRWRPAKLD